MKLVSYFQLLSLAPGLTFAEAASPVKFTAATWLSKWPVLLIIFLFVLIFSVFLLVRIRNNATLQKEKS